MSTIEKKFIDLLVEKKRAEKAQKKAVPANVNAIKSALKTSPVLYKIELPVQLSKTAVEKYNSPLEEVPVSEADAFLQEIRAKDASVISAIVLAETACGKFAFTREKFNLWPSGLKGQKMPGGGIQPIEKEILFLEKIRNEVLSKVEGDKVAFSFVCCKKQYDETFINDYVKQIDSRIEVLRSSKCSFDSNMEASCLREAHEELGGMFFDLYEFRAGLSRRVFKTTVKGRVLVSVVFITKAKLQTWGYDWDKKQMVKKFVVSSDFKTKCSQTLTTSNGDVVGTEALVREQISERILGADVEATAEIVPKHRALLKFLGF